MEERIKQIEKKLRVQRMYTLLVCALLGASFMFSFKSRGDAEVLKTKGIIIVDAQGRERILIGAPIPDAKNRVRTNLEKATATWGKAYGTETFKKYYTKLDHSANGIVFLDENGFDRVAIGNTVPDPNIGKRAGKSTGIVLNDEKGEERSGYGVLSVNGQNRVVLGLDRANGTEGVVLGVMEDGTAGVYASNKEKSLFVGNAPQGSFVTGTNKAFFGVMVRDTAKVKYSFNSEDK